MNMKLLAIAVAGMALIAAAPAANADHKHKHRHVDVYDGYGHSYGYPGYRVHERDRLPRWLRRHDHFRAWYRHTPLRYNLRLGWDELYSIFIWERCYSDHRRFHRYGHRAHRDFGYYRKYWTTHRGDRYWKKHHGDKRWKKHRGDRDHRYGRERRDHRD